MLQMLQIDSPAFGFIQCIRCQGHTAQPCNVIEERIRGLWRKDLISRFSEELEAVPIGDAGSRCDDDLRRWDSVLVISRNGISCFDLTHRIVLVDTRSRAGVQQDFSQDVLRIDNSVFVHVALYKIEYRLSCRPKLIVEEVERIFWGGENVSQGREAHVQGLRIAFWKKAIPAGNSYFAALTTSS